MSWSSRIAEHVKRIRSAATPEVVEYEVKPLLATLILCNHVEPSRNRHPDQRLRAGSISLESNHTLLIVLGGLRSLYVPSDLR